MRFVDFRRSAQLGLHALFNGNKFKVHGVDVVLPPAAGLELRYQIMRGRYENVEAEAVGKYLFDGASVIELGGSLGVISKLIRQKIGGTGTHIVVEANPEILEICRGNAVQKNAAEKTEILHAALAYGQESIGFRFGHNANVGRIDVGSGSDLIQVKTVTLSSLVAKLDRSSPYCLVCDIEGAELQMFENETSIFERLQIGILEIHPDQFENAGRSRAYFYGLLKERNINILEELGNVLVLAGPAMR